MPESLIDVGEKIHVITRRRFEEDVHPHFAGEVRAAMGAHLRAHGYQFVFDSRTNAYIRHSEPRTRLFSISDAGYILTIIPREVELEELLYRTIGGRLTMTDGNGFALEINEFGQSN